MSLERKSRNSKAHTRLVLHSATEHCFLLFNVGTHKPWLATRIGKSSSLIHYYHVQLLSSSQRQSPLPLGLLHLIDPLSGEEQRRLDVVLVAQRARHGEAERLVPDVAPTSVSARDL